MKQLLEARASLGDDAHEPELDSNDSYGRPCTRDRRSTHFKKSAFNGI